jgi:peptidoglycan/LPS O-acetylase OafA/YrhL
MDQGAIPQPQEGIASGRVSAAKWPEELISDIRGMGTIQTQAIVENAAQPLNRRGHIRILDGLRGMAILMVLFGHFYRKSFIEDTYPLGTILFGRIVAINSYGVELFFVLSGFLITGILLDTKHERGFFGKFYMRRILRIFPLYYGALAIVLLVLPHFIKFDAGAKDVVSQQGWLWTYMTSWPTAGWVWDNSNLFLLGHFWSLSVEEHFYFVWPALVAFLSKRTLFAICGFLIAVAVSCRIVAALAGTSAPMILHWLTLQKMDGLAIGAMIAVASRDDSLRRYIPDGRVGRAIMVLTGVSVLGYIWSPRKWHFALEPAVVGTLVVIFFAVVLVRAVNSRRGQLTNRFLNSKVMTAFGKYSYGLYVIHGILRPCFARLFDFGGAPKHWGLPFLYVASYWLLTIGVSFSLAYFSYHLFEKRFLALKSRFEYQRKPAADTAVPARASEFAKSV